MVNGQRSTVGGLDGLAGLVFMVVHTESVYLEVDFSAENFGGSALH